MSRSILVVDTPEYCAECPCSDDCAEVCRPLDRLITEDMTKGGMNALIK